MRVEIDEAGLRVNGELLIERGRLVSLAIEQNRATAVVSASVPEPKLGLLRVVLQGFAPNVSIERVERP